MSCFTCCHSSRAILTGCSSNCRNVSRMPQIVLIMIYDNNSLNVLSALKPPQVFFYYLWEIVSISYASAMYNFGFLPVEVYIDGSYQQVKLAEKCCQEISH